MNPRGAVVGSLSLRGNLLLVCGILQRTQTAKIQSTRKRTESINVPLNSTRILKTNHFELELFESLIYSGFSVTYQPDLTFKLSDRNRISK